MFPGPRTHLDKKWPHLSAPERLCLTTQKLRTYIPAACQCTRLRKTGSSDDQEEAGVRGEGSPLTVFSKKTCTAVISPNLIISAMTAQCGKFRHFKKYDMKTFKSNSSPGNYGLQDLF